MVTYMYNGATGTTLKSSSNLSDQSANHFTYNIYLYMSGTPVYE